VYICEVAACVTDYMTGDRGIKDALAALRVLHNFTPIIQHPVYLWGAFFITHQSSKSVYFLAFSSHVFCHYHQQL
jgi:hypothetical protein